MGSRKKVFNIFDKEACHRDGGLVFSKYTPTYTQVIEKGSKVVKINDESEFIDTDAAIQAASVGTDIYEIIARHINGQDNGIGVIDWRDQDFTSVTSSFIEMQSKIDNARKIFDGLSLNVRQQFDNDFIKFLSAVDDGTFVRRANDAPIERPLDVKKEVLANE